MKDNIMVKKEEIIGSSSLLRFMEELVNKGVKINSMKIMCPAHHFGWFPNEYDTYELYWKTKL